MAKLLTFLLIAAVCHAVACAREAQKAEVQRTPSQHSYCGNWHVFVPQNEVGGPRHEYYSIHEDNSVFVSLRDDHQRLLGNYRCRLENEVILFESGFARWPVRRDGDSLILTGDKEYRLSRVDEIPPECGQEVVSENKEGRQSTSPYVGRWHTFVPEEEDGPHHEFYEIREDNSVVCWFLGVDRRLVAKFHGQLKEDSIVSELGLVLPLGRDGDNLIIRGKKDFIFSRIEKMPPERM